MTIEKDIKDCMSSGPGKECKCQVCIFSKSQAPGQPYDITQCPLWKKEKMTKRKESK